MSRTGIGFPSREAAAAGSPGGFRAAAKGPSYAEAMRRKKNAAASGVQ
jgi:hypothetical protein